MSDDRMREIADELQDVIDDGDVPQNVRASLKEAREHLLDDSKPEGERAATTINVLNDVSDDPNLPMHVRTFIWDVSGKLETVTME